MEWTTQTYARDVHRISFDLKSTTDLFRALLISDVHIESTLCDVQMLKRHLDEAKDLGAPVLVAGDLFDVMQGKFDGRSTHRELHPELVGQWDRHEGPDGYLDRCTTWAADLLEPYADNLFMISPGNHEDGVLDRHGHDLIQGFVSKMRDRGAKKIVRSGYDGWIVWDPGYHSRRFPQRMYYHHGAGGSGRVSGGAIQMMRGQEDLGNADMIWFGHIHDEQTRRTSRYFLSRSMVREERDLQHIITPGYKMRGGWETRKRMAPKVRGGYWLQFWPYRVGGATKVNFDVRQAK